MMNAFNLQDLTEQWNSSNPFPNLVLDNFLTTEAANQIAAEFPTFDDVNWYTYESPLEIKKSLNNWDRFGVTTYRLFWFLYSYSFISKLQELVKCSLYPDFGLHGGGLHTHRSGGKLNVHLDYSMHPKLRLQRRLNLIIYVTPAWQEVWGGSLGFWEHNVSSGGPGALVTSVSPKFNRAVLFDTTQNSWHGLPEPIRCPPHVTRNSLAVYYLCEPPPGCEERERALFSPWGDQRDDPGIIDLIEQRAQSATAKSAYVRRG